MPPEVSVVICTHNRSDLLANVLISLAQQRLETHRYEVIVVDNLSTDDTQEIVKEIQRRVPNVRYFLETEVGLSHARNRGWMEAEAEYVAYVDDDCMIPPQWLTLASQIIQEPRPAVFGGPFFPFYDFAKPAWYRDAYGSRHFGSIPRSLDRAETLFGGNLFIRVQLLESLGGFPADLGMSGQQIAYGEETDFQNRLRQRYPDEICYYDPALFVYHLVRQEKTTLRWLVRAFFAKGYSGYLMSQKNSQPVFQVGDGFIRMSKLLAGLVVDSTYGLAVRDRKQYLQPQNYLYEHTARYVYGMGKLFAQYESRKVCLERC